MTATTTTHPGQDLNALIDLLTEQRDLYTELKALSARQGQLIRDAETEALLELLGRRQALVDKLTELGAAVEPHRGRIRDLAANADEPRRRTLRERVDEVQTLLGEILEQDERDRAELETARAEVGAELSRTARTGVAMSAYRRAAPGGPARFTDRQG